MPSAADRMQAIMQDKRALFLPITCNEKNEALALLDYVGGANSDQFAGTSEHPGGVHDHLFEIYSRQKKNAIEAGNIMGAKIVAGLAVQSVLFEYADFYNGHAQGARDLTVLAGRLRGFGKQAGVLRDVADECKGSETGMAAFVRTLDIAAVKDRGRKRSVPPFDPLRTVELRGKTGVEGKNKTVTSRYCHINDKQRDIIDDHIEKTIDNYTVGDALTIMPNMQRNAQNGMSFWGRVLRSQFREYQPKADAAIATTDLGR